MKDLIRENEKLRTENAQLTELWHQAQHDATHFERVWGEEVDDNIRSRKAIRLKLLNFCAETLETDDKEKNKAAINSILNYLQHLK